VDSVHITRDNESGLVREIMAEAEKLYQDRYGKRSPDTLSTQELDDVKTEAGKRVQERRKGRLVP